MKDYEIKIENANEVILYATDNDTIVVPSSVHFETDRDQAEINIDGVENVLIGIPPKAGHIELFIKDSRLQMKGISFERMEIDGDGKLSILADHVDGNIDVNLLKSEAELIVSSDYVFTTRTEGKNNEIDCQAKTDPNAKNVIELNGKNSKLTIRNA